MSNDRAMTVLVHGLSKAGKSTFSVTSPAPRLYMDVEAASRFLPIRRVYWNPMESGPPEYDGTWDTCVVPTTDWDVVLQAYKWLASGQHPFKSFIIDSISELQQRFLQKITGRSQATQQQWGDAFREVGGLIRDIRDLTLVPDTKLEAVVLTAMTKHVDGMWRPWVQGQLLSVMPYLLDVVGYLYTEQVPVSELSVETVEIRRLLTRRTGEYEAGERVGGRLPIVVDNPNVVEMLDAVFGPSGETAPPVEPVPAPAPAPAPAPSPE